MNEEQYLIEKVGKENPFRVPEGYFDTLASQVMSRIDAEGNKPQDVPMTEKKACSLCRCQCMCVVHKRNGLSVLYC